MEMKRNVFFLMLKLLVITTGSFAQHIPTVSTDVFTSANNETVMHCTFTTAAPVDKIWKAIATADGLSQWAAPAAVVDLKIGGSYELHFRPDNPPGKRGMEGNKILSFNTHKMISYSGGLPDTWVVYSIEPEGEKLKVHFYGIGTHPEWKSKCADQAPKVADFIANLAKYLGE